MTKKHNEPETILQPSLHTIEEYTELVLNECEAREIDVKDLREEYYRDDDCDYCNDVIDDAISRLRDAGYPIVEEDDTFLICQKDRREHTRG